MRLRHSPATGALRSAFTLIEVLVVVAIIALLTAILIPSLVKAREQASGAVCRSNMHQLMLGMHTYVASEKVMPGSFNVLFASFASKHGGLPGPYNSNPTNNWKPGDDWLGLPWPPKQWNAAANPTDLKELQEFVAGHAPHKGSLYRYVRSEKVYLCPKDHKGTPDPEDPKGGGGNGRYSYTMFGLLGFKPPERSTNFTYVRNFTQVLTNPAVTIPAGTRKVWSMSKVFSLAEEHPFNNINQGWVGESWDAGSYLAFRHHTTPNGGMGIFAFLDGHVEARRYDYFIRDNAVFPPQVRKFQGIDLLNDYQIPYAYPGTGDGNANYDTWLHKFPYPY